MPDPSGTLVNTQCTCHLTGGSATCSVHNAFASSFARNVPIVDSDRLAREVAMAAVEWLASDGDDDKFDVLEAKVKKWKELVLDGR